MKKRNNKGFTLVELLAVIVILAIIMVIAIPSVLTTMKTAKMKSFKEYALKASNKAQETYAGDQLITNPGSCVLYKIGKDIGLSSTGDFKGYVVVKNTNNESKIYVTLNDNDYMIYAADYNKLDSIDLQSYDSTTTNLTSSNILSVAGCSEYTEKKEATNVLDTNLYENKTITLSEDAKSSTQKLFTGEKEGGNGWVGVYVDGVINECYQKSGNFTLDYKSTFDGSRETSYCVGVGYESTNESECRKHKSTICCTMSATEHLGNLSSQTLHYFLTNNNNPSGSTKSCGITYCQTKNGIIPLGTGVSYGGGLPASGVYEE